MIIELQSRDTSSLRVPRFGGSPRARRIFQCDAAAGGTVTVTRTAATRSTSSTSNASVASRFYTVMVGVSTIQCSNFVALAAIRHPGVHLYIVTVTRTRRRVARAVAGRLGDGQIRPSRKLNGQVYHCQRLLAFAHHGVGSADAGGISATGVGRSIRARATLTL